MSSLQVVDVLSCSVTSSIIVLPSICVGLSWHVYLYLSFVAFYTFRLWSSVCDHWLGLLYFWRPQSCISNNVPKPMKPMSNNTCSCGLGLSFITLWHIQSEAFGTVDHLPFIFNLSICTCSKDFALLLRSAMGSWHVARGHAKVHLSIKLSRVEVHVGMKHFGLKAHLQGVTRTSARPQQNLKRVIGQWQSSDVLSAGDEASKTGTLPRVVDMHPI